MKVKLRRSPVRPDHDAVWNAHTILCNTHDACLSFLDVFETRRQARNAKGAPTNEEQDLLRAMLIFATSGLDSMTKQLVRDALPTVVERDEGARRAVTAHIERTIRRAEQTDVKTLCLTTTLTQAQWWRGTSPSDAHGRVLRDYR